MVFGIFKKKGPVVFTRKKTAARKTIKNKKIAKRPIRVKRALKKKAAGKKVSKIKKAPAISALEVVGKITHYFPHVKAGVIKLERPLAIGDNIHILGHTTNFKQTIKSMQIDNVPIKDTKPGDEIGLLVKSRVRHNDVVYRL